MSKRLSNENIFALSSSTDQNLGLFVRHRAQSIRSYNAARFEKNWLFLVVTNTLTHIVSLSFSENKQTFCWNQRTSSLMATTPQ